MPRHDSKICISLAVMLTVFVACDDDDGGDDGATTAGGSSSTTEPGTSSSSGAAVNCAELAADYADALAVARSCEVGGSECTELVFATLVCPCDEIFANPAEADALATLAALSEAFDAGNCDEGTDCPTVECEPNSTAVCVDDGQGGGVCASP